VLRVAPTLRDEIERAASNEGRSPARLIDATSAFGTKRTSRGWVPMSAFGG